MATDDDKKTTRRRKKLKEDTVKGEGREASEVESDEVKNGSVENETLGKRKRTRKKTDPSVSDKTLSLEHTVYVEGIPFDGTEEEVKEFFVEHGCDDVLQMRLPRWQDTGRLRGYGHVVFHSTLSRQKAIATLHGRHLKHRYLTITEPKPPKLPTPPSRPRDPTGECTNILFVKNIPYHATEEDIAAVFATFGPIATNGVRIARNYTTFVSKGFAYVEFQSSRGASNALRHDDPISILGRPCLIDHESGTNGIKNSFITKDGRNWKKAHGSTPH